MFIIQLHYDRFSMRNAPFWLFISLRMLGICCLPCMFQSWNIKGMLPNKLWLMATYNGSGRVTTLLSSTELWQRGKILQEERNRPRAIVYSERPFEVGGHFLSRLLNEHFVCILLLCKSLSASKSYFLPLHNNGGHSNVHDKDTEPDNVFLSGGADSWTKNLAELS